MPRACFITTKAIAAGEEITIDYSNGFWETELGLQAEEAASVKAEAYRARVATAVQTAEQSGPEGRSRTGSDGTLADVQDVARRSVAQQRQHDAERAAAEACGGGMAADEYEKRWAAEQRAQMKAAIARLRTELGSMQEDFYNTADEMIDLSQETLRLQHEADREATRAKLLEGAGGAKSKLAARLATKKAAAAKVANG
jgi:hypothetical protein